MCQYTNSRVISDKGCPRKFESKCGVWEQNLEFGSYTVLKTVTNSPYSCPTPIYEDSALENHRFVTKALRDLEKHNKSR